MHRILCVVILAGIGCALVERHDDISANSPLKWKDDLSPIDPALGGYASTFHSKAYLRHLIMNKEILGAQIATLQNLTFYLWLVKEARKQIQAGTFAGWKNTMIPVVSRRL